MSVDKQKLWQLAGRAVAEINLPGSQETVRLRELNVAQRAQFIELVKEKLPPVELMARLLSLAAIGSDGEQMFEESDLPQLMDLSPSFLDAASTTVMNLSGLGVKKAPQGQNDSSSSSLH